MTIHLKEWEIRITRHFYGIFMETRIKGFQAFSVGFIHFVRITE
jgi:hypothetical protein